MEESTEGCDEPANLLLHEVINQLTVIVGNCDLMSPELREGSESAKRLGLIHEAAIKMAEAPAAERPASDRQLATRGITFPPSRDSDPLQTRHWHCLRFSNLTSQVKGGCNGDSSSTSFNHPNLERPTERLAAPISAW